MPDNKVTFSDIAKYTGFSKTTISRYFNNPDSVSFENQIKIEQALKKFNYKKNKIAKILASGQSECIGLIVPNLSHEYYSSILNQLLSAKQNNDYKFIVFSSQNDIETERKYLQELLEYKVDGLILLSPLIHSKELSTLNIPIVGIERENQYIHSVLSDNYFGANTATQQLIKNNCDILFFIGEDLSVTEPLHKRLEGFCDTCEKYKKTNHLYIHPSVDSYAKLYPYISEIYNILEKDFSSEKLGIFLGNETQSRIFLDITFRKYGTLPNRYHIIGYDYSPLSREVMIPISTISLKADVMAQTAMNILISKINANKNSQQNLSKEFIHAVISSDFISR